MPRQGRKALTREQVAARLDAGEWLSPGHVARLLGVSRFTVIRMMESEPRRIGWRLKNTIAEQRECDPEDVRRLLARRDDSYHPSAPPSE